MALLSWAPAPPCMTAIPHGTCSSRTAAWRMQDQAQTLPALGHPGRKHSTTKAAPHYPQHPCAGRRTKSSRTCCWARAPARPPARQRRPPWPLPAHRAAWGLPWGPGLFRMPCEDLLQHPWRLAAPLEALLMVPAQVWSAVWAGLCRVCARRSCPSLLCPAASLRGSWGGSMPESHEGPQAASSQMLLWHHRRGQVQLGAVSWLQQVHASAGHSST